MAHTITRRSFLATAAAGTLAAGLPNVVTPARAASKNELVFVGFGGSYQDGQTKALFEPFEKETGIKVVQTTGVDLAKLRAQVQSKNVEWDLVSIPDRLRYTAVRDGLVQKLDYKIIDAKDVMPELVTEHAVGCVTIPMLLTYSTTAYPTADKAPKTWMDFWDPKKVAGPAACTTRRPTSWSSRSSPTACRRTSSTRWTSPARSRASIASSPRSRSGGRSSPSRASFSRAARSR